MLHLLLKVHAADSLCEENGSELNQTSLAKLILTNHILPKCLHVLDLHGFVNFEVVIKIPRSGLLCVKNLLANIS